MSSPTNRDFARQIFHFSQEGIKTLSDRDNTQNRVSFLHKMAYTLLVGDNATAVSELQFNVDIYSCR